jgi:hypothetical protein
MSDFTSPHGISPEALPSELAEAVLALPPSLRPRLLTHAVRRLAQGSAPSALRDELLDRAEKWAMERAPFDRSGPVSGGLHGDLG